MRAALIVFALLCASASALYLLEALTYERGTLARPGPGLYPVLVGVVLMVGSIAVGLEGRYSEAVADWPRGPALRRVGVLLAAAFAYAIISPLLGHAVMAAVVSLVIFHMLGLSDWPLRIVLAFLLGFGSYYLFLEGLNVRLPTGSLWGN